MILGITELKLGTSVTNAEVNIKLNLLQSEYFTDLQIQFCLSKQIQGLLPKFSLTEIIKEPNRITCSTSSLLDHILTNSSEKSSLKG